MTPDSGAVCRELSPRLSTCPESCAQEGWQSPGSPESVPPAPKLCPGPDGHFSRNPPDTPRGPLPSARRPPTPLGLEVPWAPGRTASSQPRCGHMTRTDRPAASRGRVSRAPGTWAAQRRTRPSRGVTTAPRSDPCGSRRPPPLRPPKARWSSTAGLTEAGAEGRLGCPAPLPGGCTASCCRAGVRTWSGLEAGR